MTSNDSLDSTPEGDAGRRGEFFVVDRRAFAAACALGLNPAVAYLAIARGAGSRPTSRWSVNAIEEHTAMSRPKAQRAIEALLNVGLLTRAGAATQPVYGIIPGHEAGLSEKEREVVKLLGGGKARLPKRLRDVGLEMGSRGYLIPERGGTFSINDPARFSDKPQHVWLPNAIVDGAAGETPPLALLRQMQDVQRLQLFVMLYDNHDLPEDGGVSRKFLWQEQKLTKVGERGASTIWGFSKADRTAPFGSPLRQIFWTGKKDKDGNDPGQENFWPAIRGLRDCGLIEFIPHVFESGAPEAEILHPYPIDAVACEPWEHDVATAAQAAGMECLTAAQRQWAYERGLHLLPVPAHMSKLAVIGIARLRYRPRTKKTAAWFAKSKEGCEAWEAVYVNIFREAASHGSAVA
jgi:hypothetical protein